MKGILMKSMFFTLMFIITVSLLSCSADKAAELFETAQFEELQNNDEHARQIYEDIVKKYPKSDTARKAEERLTAMGKTKQE